MGFSEGDKATIINCFIDMKWRVKVKVYEGRRKPFTSLAQLKRRIMYVWESAIDEEATHKAILQFRKRLRAVVVNKGGPIQHLYR